MINGLNEGDNLPIYHGPDLAVICNGEIYNFKQLETEHALKYTTNNDCESAI